jgi:hypothetical protein
MILLGGCGTNADRAARRYGFRIDARLEDSGERRTHSDEHHAPKNRDEDRQSDTGRIHQAVEQENVHDDWSENRECQRHVAIDQKQRARNARNSDESKITVRPFDGRMAFVLEGRSDSRARSAWMCSLDIYRRSRRRIIASSVIRPIRGPKWPKERSPGFTPGLPWVVLPTRIALKGP